MAGTFLNTQVILMIKMRSVPTATAMKYRMKENPTGTISTVTDTAAYLNSKAANMSKATTKIDGSSYFFNAYGVRQTGLIHTSPLQAKILPDILVKMILTER